MTRGSIVKHIHLINCVIRNKTIRVTDQYALNSEWCLASGLYGITAHQFDWGERSGAAIGVAGRGQYRVLDKGGYEWSGERRKERGRKGMV